MRASQREAELLELVITGLSHLVSANTESGFKQCLPLAYDQDIRKRTIFAHVFARVLGQGTKFEAEDRSEAHARQNRLCEVRNDVLPLELFITDIVGIIVGQRIRCTFFHCARFAETNRLLDGSRYGYL